MSMNDDEEEWNRTKSSTHFRAGPIDFELKMVMSMSAGQHWMFPKEERPSIVQ